MPPKEVVRAVEGIQAASKQPFAAFAAPGGRWVLLAQLMRQAQSIQERSRPVLHINGWIIDPAGGRTWNPARAAGKSFSLFEVSSGRELAVETPAGSYAAPVWSPDGSRFAVMHTPAEGPADLV